MQKLYFIRHGLSVNNSLGKLSGMDDTPLHDTGRTQAAAAGRDIKELKLNIDTIVCSPLSRCIDTAKLIAAEINYPEDKIIVNELFRERNFGPFEGQDYQTVVVREIEGVETVQDILIRANEALDYLHKLDQAKNILVVSHSAFGRALRHHTLKTPYDHSERFKNAEVVRLV